MGVDDAVFTALVAKLLNGTDPGDIDPALLEPLHIVLMDAAHAEIDIDGLQALNEGSVQTAVGLRYLAPEARLVSTWRALERGLIDHGKAAKLWRSATITPDTADLALARHRSQPSALTRALAWRALDADKTARRMALIAAMMDVDISDGAGLKMAPLYAELVRETLGFEGAEAMLQADPGLAGKLGLLVSVGDDGALPDILATDTARAARALLEMSGLDMSGGNGEVDLAPLGTLALWHLLPLVEPQADAPANQDTDQTAAAGGRDEWIGLAMPAAVKPASYLSVSPLMLRALEQAAADGRVAETVLLAHRIIGDIDLAALHPADAARVVAALSAAGQPVAARAFGEEVATAHVMAMMQSVEITVPAVAEAGTAEGATAEGVVDGEGTDVAAIAEVTATEATNGDASGDANTESSSDADASPQPGADDAN